MVLMTTTRLYFSISSPGLTFGDPSKIKILKKIRPTIIGGNDADIILSWTYDFSVQANTSRFRWVHPRLDFMACQNIRLLSFR